MKHICCPHCGEIIEIPVRGPVQKDPKPIKEPLAPKPPKPPKQKIGLPDILGERFDDYWKVAAIFGHAKNYAPMETAALYMAHIHAGVDPLVILSRASCLMATTSEQKYLPQFSRWLSGQDFHANMPSNPERAENDPGSSRLLSRRRAE